MRSLLADHEQDTDGLGLDLDDTQQVQDGAAATALRKQVLEALAGTPSKGRSLGPSFKTVSTFAIHSLNCAGVAWTMVKTVGTCFSPSASGR